MKKILLCLLGIVLLTGCSFEDTNDSGKIDLNALKFEYSIEYATVDEMIDYDCPCDVARYYLTATLNGEKTEFKDIFITERLKQYSDDDYVNDNYKKDVKIIKDVKTKEEYIVIDYTNSPGYMSIEEGFVILNSDGKKVYSNQAIEVGFRDTYDDEGNGVPAVKINDNSITFLSYEGCEYGYRSRLNISDGEIIIEKFNEKLYNMAGGC